MARGPIDLDVMDFVQAIGLLVRRVRTVAGAHQLSWSESCVAAHLAKVGPATTADLARAQGVRPQSMGTTIAALEEAGIVERTPHPTDGRQVNIQLTVSGSALRKRVKDAKVTWLAHEIDTLDRRDRETLFKATAIIQRLAESK